MKLVIDIDKETYNRYIHWQKDGGHVQEAEEIIANGTPLPEGHGRLIDANSLLACLEQDSREAFSKHQVWLMFSEYNEDVPTIVEADKENNNEIDN